MAVRGLVVHLEQLTWDLGLWCNTCRLSTGVRVWFTATCADSMVLRSTLGCTDCDGSDIEDAA